MGPQKSRESQLWEFWDYHLGSGSPGTKCHLGAGLVARHIVYYKGEGDGFPQVRAVMSLVSSSLLMTHSSTNNVLVMH